MHLAYMYGMYMNTNTENTIETETHVDDIISSGHDTLAISYNSLCVHAFATTVNQKNPDEIYGYKHGRSSM